jgi:hypothetical protein
MKVVDLKDIAAHLPPKIDVLICSASFEARCKSVPMELDPAFVEQALICENRDVAVYAKDNIEALLNHFSKNTKIVSLSLSDPLNIADRLGSNIDRVLSDIPQTFLVDTTTFTRESLIILVLLLKVKLQTNKELIFTYASASDYSIGDRNNEIWLSKGVKEVRSILGFPGNPSPSRRCHLIILSGFENERAIKLIESYEPAILSVGVAREADSVDPKHFEKNLAFHKILCNLYTNVDIFSFSATDVLQARDDLKAQVLKHRGYNVVVAPLNNKLSTIGATLAALEDEDIQLCYAQANEYNYEAYSTPGDKCYIFSIPDFLEIDPAQNVGAD